MKRYHAKAKAILKEKITKLVDCKSEIELSERTKDKAQHRDQITREVDKGQIKCIYR